jgi:hypothetical protein
VAHSADSGSRDEPLVCHQVGDGAEDEARDDERAEDRGGGGDQSTERGRVAGDELRPEDDAERDRARQRQERQREEQQPTARRDTERADEPQLRSRDDDGERRTDRRAPREQPLSCA